uniref:Uncharacterized protein n=1 Tax=Peronospora matthiolae TaxID=2874970 RepID=A0AAV1VHM8_9STRA
MFLSPDRDLSPGSPDHGGHTPTVPDRPGSPRHLGPAGSPTIATGSPDRRPTRPSFPARDLPSGSPDRGWYAPIVPDQHESLSNPRSVGSLSTDAELSDRSSEPFPLPTPPAAPDASRSDVPAANESRERSAPAVGITGFVPRVSADDVRLTLATISYIWDREATICSQADTIHALQQSYRDPVAREDRL